MTKWEVIGTDEDGTVVVTPVKEDSLRTISERSKNIVGSHSLARAENRLRDAEESVRITRVTRDAQRVAFWANFSKVFQPGDTIRWFDGWDMRLGTYNYHSDWHIHLTTAEGVNVGLPVVLDGLWEKVV